MLLATNIVAKCLPNNNIGDRNLFMKTFVDFLFLYELKNRELENICLLKYELEKRGYSVGLINTWQYLGEKKPRINAQVMLSFALYNDKVYGFVSGYCNKYQKIINLQWEQIGTINDVNNPDSCFYIKGIPQKAVHLAWGKATKDRLVSCGIDGKNIKITGHVGMDFLHEKLLPYYLPKDELFSQYNIPLDKKVCFFISSFASTATLDNEDTGRESANLLSKEYATINFDDFMSISTVSQERIIKWIEKVLDERDDLIFIYRPHPAEYISDELKNRISEARKFFVISEHSVKQWIITSDTIFTWYSTSLAEVYFAKKNCHILRPVEIPIEMELEIYKNAEFITTYNDFVSVIDSDSSSFPVSEVNIHYYYSQDDSCSYMKICDVFEEVLKDRSINVPLPKKAPLTILIKQKLITTRIMKWCTNLLRHRFNYFACLYNKYYDVSKHIAQMKERNSYSGKETGEILNKIRACIEKK